VAAWLIWGRRPPSSPPDPFPLPPYSASRFLNTGPDARYIGTAACAACHADNHKSYLLTAHSRSLAELDPGAEPPDGSFEHQLSGRSYRVYRQGREVHHEEVLRTAEGQEITRVDVPVRYRIGSGNVTRSYLVELDGFLHESPITWYAADKKWRMSPGYDFPHHWGFDRPILADCLACHAGRAEAVDGTLHRIALHEPVIGCENCHGPGSLHEARHRHQKHAPGAEDWTIVNPGKLSRTLMEDICATCHLNGPATVLLRGRRSGDFRPGTPLTDYRTNYRFAQGSEQMTVVGHLAQLRQSTCYQQSDMTCLTCHDPHARSRPEEMSAFYRQRCLSCHTVQSCRLDQDQRLKKDTSDNCLACHMPRGDTEMPHIVFTNHRIVRQPPPRPTDWGPGRALLPIDSSEPVPELVPTAEASQLAPLDGQRNLGLAYYEASQNPVYVRYGYGTAFEDRARHLLETVQAAGLPDPETTAALAQLYWNKDSDAATVYAWRAFQTPGLSTTARVPVLFRLAVAAMQDGAFDMAGRRLEELVHLRRDASDWYFLGQCYLEQGQTERALPALKQALAIRPDRYATHVGLAEVYRRLGQMDRAQEHQDKARWLRANRPE
jgi:Flp pilus assembly protein TadD